MATPEAYTQALLDYAGLTISRYIRDNVSPDGQILDVGAGWGKYRFLLPEYEMDAVEIWQPYVGLHHLDAYYRRVFVEDITEFKMPQRYSAVVMGDTLEHIPRREAWGVIENLCNNADLVCVAVPFEMEQEPVDGNKHEAHLQPDLSEELMAERYPQLELLEKFGRPGEHVKAIYVSKNRRNR